ncbi:MAG: dihydropteroate synthase [Candidatus Humimicrobiaceae bacterium]
MKYKIRALDIKNRAEGMSEFEKIGSTVAGQKIMVEKLFPLAIKVKGLKVLAINILKQEMLARGGDVVTSRDTLLETRGTTDVIIEGHQKSFKSLIPKLRMQPFGLKDLADELEIFLKDNKNNRNKKSFRIGKKKFDLISNTLVMGIINVTPDSFFDGGKYNHKDQAVKRISEMIADGADIIDIGGLSSRPGSKPVSLEEELERTIPVIESVSNNFDTLISIDTYRSEIALEAISAGAHMVNDISAFNMDKNMAGMVADKGVSVTLMHMQGKPEDMQKNPQYENVVDEIYEYLDGKANDAIGAGISPDKIILDPGIGFGKTLDHNLSILNKISEFSSMGYPIMVGASRKSFIGGILDLPVEDRLEGSLAAAVWSVINGANILRVHDVAETVRAVKTARSIMSGF